MRKKRFVALLGILFWIILIWPQVVRASDGVAYVYIISCTNTQGSSTDGGREHTFLVVENLTDDTIVVGHYNLAGGESVSIGSYGNIDDGEYAYYNIEKYRMTNGLVTYTPNAYIRAMVNESQIENLGNAINNNNKWTLFYNCTVFARNCWNSMFPTSNSYRITASLIENPADMYNKIKAKAGSDYDYEFELGNLSINNVYVHTSTGKKNLGTVGQYQVMLR